MTEASLQSIYTSQLTETTLRLIAAKRFLDAFAKSGEAPEIESAVLQLRKALETMAFAAIAPDKKRYETFRATALKAPDFTKDFHAAKIFTALAHVNPDFYPRPLTPAEKRPDGTWHFGQRQGGFLSKKRFEAAYDRLGKHLHAHNPWSGNKNIQNLVADLPTIIDETHGLLDLHARFIRAPGFEGVWIFETDRLGSPPRLLIANSMGPYVVT
jgi:hypothetical protein